MYKTDSQNNEPLHSKNVSIGGSSFKCRLFVLRSTQKLTFSFIRPRKNKRRGWLGNHWNSLHIKRETVCITGLLYFKQPWRWENVAEKFTLFLVWNKCIQARSHGEAFVGNTSHIFVRTSLNLLCPEIFLLKHMIKAKSAPLIMYLPHTLKPSHGPESIVSLLRTTILCFDVFGKKNNFRWKIERNLKSDAKSNDGSFCIPDTAGTSIAGTEGKTPNQKCTFVYSHHILARDRSAEHAGTTRKSGPSRSCNRPGIQEVRSVIVPCKWYTRSTWGALTSVRDKSAGRSSRISPSADLRHLAPVSSKNIKL